MDLGQSLLDILTATWLAELELTHCADGALRWDVPGAVLCTKIDSLVLRQPHKADTGQSSGVVMEESASPTWQAAEAIFREGPDVRFAFSFYRPSRKTPSWSAAPEGR